MSYLKDLVREQKKIEQQQQRAARAKARYGVFIWRGDGVYREENAIQVYKSKVLAQNKADKLNQIEMIYVVRQIA